MDKLFNTYLQELIDWNKKFNLTAITDPEKVRAKHFEDSLSILQAVDLKDQNVIDVGAGAGFPSLPLKIKCPEIKLTLLDATKKKTEFLKHIVNTLDLKDVEVVWSRAEDYAKEKREAFDLAVARAVAPLNILAELCLPFVKVGGLFIAQKSDQAEQEIKLAESAIEILGGKLKEIKKMINGDQRFLVVIEKIKPTPEKFPRRAGIAKKRPLS